MWCIIDKNELLEKSFSKTLCENDKSHSLPQVRFKKMKKREWDVMFDLKFEFLGQFLKNGQVKHLLPNLF